MDDLVQWLRAQLDEDERAVRNVLGEGALTAMEHGKPAPRWVPSPKNDVGIWDTDGIPRVKYAYSREREHIIRHDPARVLREIDAKRQMLGRINSHAAVTGRDEVHDDLLRLLALPYADRPGYREEWRP